MSLESEQSAPPRQPTSEEQHRDAPPTPTGEPAVQSDAPAQQIYPPPSAYPPFPYRYAAYPPYSSYATYTYPSYPPYPYTQYPAYPYVPMSVAPTTSSLAIASFICGLLTLFAFPYLGIAAAICGHIALGQIRSSGGFVEGRGFAIAGLILGYGLLGLGVIGFLFYFLLFAIISIRTFPAGFVFPFPQ